MIKANQIMLRVGGGFATFEQYIRQVGPFECIKIYKTMKKDGKGFKDAVAFYLHKLKPPKNIIVNYMNVSEEDQAELFESAIEYLKQKQDEHNERYEESKQVRRGTTTRRAGSGSPTTTASNRSPTNR